MGSVVRGFPFLRLLDIGRRHGSITIAELNRLLPIDGPEAAESGHARDALRNRGVAIVLSRSSSSGEGFHLLNDDRIVYPR
ncbi:hypothetical protein SAE02_15010 [Skermanella aerolata]|uniref:Uncharacterized protein n=1 Tax=Skermanella aerolata TaxID=393310 RepID=A0A512DLK1_9PROT|nr:hypothetical protein [Skermanella aerolata]KJB96434.1 hypothetical protein N826_34975 [Skermanella aerolata KACC 11604]GEO37353.1 hypothetical protein SAE02_15010 [Skermanella aerolata]